MADAQAATRAPGGCRERAVVDGKALTEEAADRLRLAPGTTRGARSDEFVLRDGRLLVQPSVGEAGTLFTRAAFGLRRTRLVEELRFRGVAEGEWFHPLRRLIDDGARFPGEVPVLVAQLERRLAADGEPATAAGVSAFAKRWREHGCREDPALFRELTAWVGELVAKRAHGRWTTRAGEGGVIEPVIEATVGCATRTLAPWDWISRLLDSDAAHVDALVAEALAPAPASQASAAPTEEREGPEALRRTPLVEHALVDPGIER